MHCEENTSESDLHSYEATKAVAKKAQKKVWGFMICIISYAYYFTLFVLCILIELTLDLQGHYYFTLYAHM